MGKTKEPVGDVLELPLFELLEAVEYVARHDDMVVVIRDGQVAIAAGPGRTPA